MLLTAYHAVHLAGDRTSLPSTERATLTTAFGKEKADLVIRAAQLKASYLVNRDLRLFKLITESQEGCTLLRRYVPAHLLPPEAQEQADTVSTLWIKKR